MTTLDYPAPRTPAEQAEHDRIEPAPVPTACTCPVGDGPCPWCEMQVGRDPFASTPDADPAECEIRKPWKSRPEKTVGLGSGFAPKKKRADLNPLERKWLTAHGYTFERVERPNTFGSVTVDLWGCGDYLCCHPEEGVLLVQVTTMAHAADREKKARKRPELAVWLKAGGRFQIHAWKQPGGAGTRWECVVREVRL